MLKHFLILNADPDVSLRKATAVGLNPSCANARAIHHPSKQFADGVWHWLLIVADSDDEVLYSRWISDEEAGDIFEKESMSAIHL